MSLILNIDTATEVAIVSISENEKVLASAINSSQKDHASFLQSAIKKILKEINVAVNALNAVSVTAGPGSYTGLRVGMASAKGLCYALNIPMITINTLEVIALSCINEVENKEALFCPMIDARRMEVFTAFYDKDLKEVAPPSSLILEINSFDDLLHKNEIYFSGSGAAKWMNIVQDKNAKIFNKQISPEAMAYLSYKKFINKDFADVASTLPVYLKEFHTIESQQKL